MDTGGSAGAAMQPPQTLLVIVLVFVTGACASLQSFEWVPTAPAYSQSSATFIKELRDTEKHLGREIFRWHRSSEGGIDYAVHSPRHAQQQIGERPALRIMVVAGSHAREPFTSELARIWMLGSLLFDNDTARSQDVEWIYVPIANPCGRDIVTSAYASSLHDKRAGNSWRVCKRTNCRGVDLNRNWITFEEQIYESHHVPGAHAKRRAWKGAPEENPGPEAFSEPETRAIRSIISEYSPIDLLLSFHSGATAVLVPPDGTKSGWQPIDRDSLLAVGRWVAAKGCPDAERATRRTSHPSCASGSIEKLLHYSAEGTMADYAVMRGGVTAALTLEVYSGWHRVNISALGPTPAAYTGNEQWGSDPFDCFSVYNPHPERILDASKSWVRLWHELYYMNGASAAQLRETLAQRRARVAAVLASA